MDGLHPVTLYMYPANELVRIGPPPTHRDWARRWVDAGGHTFDGRMIALKDDPIWCAISDFQLPFPPFAVGSGMGVRDVDRDTAEKLGVVARHQRVSPKEVRRPSLIMLEQTREEA